MSIDAKRPRLSISEQHLFQDSYAGFDPCRAVTWAAGAYALIGGAVTFLGWTLGIQRLTDWAGTGISMFANTALCAIMCGVALLLLPPAGFRSWRTIAVRFLGLLVAIIGGLTLFEHITDLNLGIDTLLFNKPWGQRAAAAPMRMGPPASLSFLLLGTALFRTTGCQRARRFASILGTIPVAIASLSLIGFWFGTDQLYTVVHLTGIAIQTSSIVAVCGIGILASLPEYGIVSLLQRDDAGGMLVRRLLLPVIAGPLLLGWLRVLGEQYGFYDSGFGRSILLLSMITMLVTLLALTANSISRADEALREREQRYELVLNGAEAAIWDWDVKNKHVMYSPRWKQLRGLSESEVGDSVEEWSQRIHPDDRARVMAAVQAHFENHTPVFAAEYRIQHKDGRWLWILNRGIARRDANGDAVRMAGSETDITERKQAEDDLRQADRHKNEFLATLAHELRNPLAPIRNSLQILQLSNPVNSETQEVQDIMKRQINHMVRLVDDLLEVSRISSGKIELRTEPIDVAAVLRSALETSKPLIEENRHHISLQLPKEPLTVIGDPIRLSQVVANLLNNAAKYTEPGGQIWLTVSVKDGQVSISVRDTGIGISDNMLPQVFRMFTQVDKDHKRAQGGLGIGLALAKKIIDMHGGRIEVFSDGVGRGSEFVISLPIAAAQPRVPENVASPVPTDGQANRCNVLVVDDNLDAAGSLAMLLRLRGHDVHEANDGVAALEAIQTFQPAVVLLDLGMPGMSGYEVAQRARTLPEGRECVLVALTGWGQEDDRRRTREAGFNHHIVKPIDVQTLETLLSEVQSRPR